MTHSRIRFTTVPFLVLFCVSLFPMPAVAAQSATAAAVPLTSVPAPGSGVTKPAATRITKEQALSIITGYFGAVTGPGKVEASLNQISGRSIWELEYTIRRENSGYSTSLASVDAETGRVLRYGAYTPEMRQPRTGPLGPAYPESYARTWAWALVRDLYPEFAPQLTLSTGPNPLSNFGRPGFATDTYVFTWELTHDSIPVPSRSVQVTMEKDTLNYVSLSQTLIAPITFAGGPAKVTPDQAMQTFAAVEPQLSYQISAPAAPFPSSATAKPQVALVYTLGVTPVWADSGKPISQPDPIAAKPEPLPPSGAPPEPAKLPLTQDDAVALVRTLLDAPASAQSHVSAAPGPFGPAEDVVSVDLFGARGSYGWASVNLKTGRILYAGRSSQGTAPTEPGQELTAEQKAKARATAVGLVQRLFPALSSQVRVRESTAYFGPDSPPVASFSFVRYQGDIPVPSNQIFVTIDAATLKLQNLSVQWNDDLAFPDPQKAISPEGARKLFLDGRTVRLIWLEEPRAMPVPMPYDPYGSAQPATMRLAYTLSAPSTIPYNQVDALTGKPVDWRNQDAPAVDVDKLLTGHRAEGELRYLLDLGTITPAKLNPDAAITRGDALQLLVNSKRYPFGGGYYEQTDQVPYGDVAPTTPLYQVVQSALTAGILTPQGEKPTFRPDAQLTRAEFAVWVARSLGLGKLARSGLKTDAPAGLTDPEQRNAVAFLEALGILSGGDYTAPLTQADAAAMTVRLIIDNQNP